MNNMWKKMFLKYFIFCINSFNTITININVIRLYDYFIIGGLFVRGAYVHGAFVQGAFVLQVYSHSHQKILLHV